MSAGERRGLDAKRNNKKEKERPRPAPAPPEAAAAAALSPERCGVFLGFLGFTGPPAGCAGAVSTRPFVVVAASILFDERLV